MFEAVELRHISSRQLNPLLTDETEEWGRELDWDFSRSAELVRNFADQRQLGGLALMERGEAIGYGYVVLEDRKGLIGDIYVRPAWRNSDAEIRLLRAVLDILIGAPHMHRIESQLMLVDPATAKALQRERFLRLFERLLMRIDARAVLPAGGNPEIRRFRVEPWSDDRLDSAATVISLAYDGHVDALINDQYRTFTGARQFLDNIVQFPGCGAFFRPASFVAQDLVTGSVAGVVLTSFVADETAHITQLCVTPHAKGRGLGYELLRQAMGALRAAGAKRISLTETAGNRGAVELYRRCGFVEMRRFFAYVWEAD